MIRLGPILGLFLMVIPTKARGFSLLNDPSLDSLLDPDESSPAVGCESYDSPYWDQIERAARQKLGEIKKIKEGSSGGRERGRERRDSYGHDDHDTQVVVRCKHGYTGRLSQISQSQDTPWECNSGLFSFLAIPLLMGNIMINIMNMIDVNVNIMAMVNAAGGRMINSKA